MIRIDVLGPLRVRAGSAEQADERSIGGRRERLVLALLATAPGRHLGDDRLVDELWGEDPPAGATSAVQVAVSRIRRSLGADAEVRRDAAGYSLVGAEVDADELTAAAQRVATLEPAEVIAVADAALALWRGEPYVGLGAAPTLAQEATRLDEVRLGLVEARAQALLDLGRPEEAHLALSPLRAAHPFRERLWSLLALALYRSDRQAEALETIRLLRAGLVDELGVDPSASVRALEERLLSQDPALDGPPPAAVPTAAPHAPAPLAAPSADATRSRVSGVVGRAAALAALHSALDDLASAGRGGVLLISGDAGIGKSMLATEVVHQARERNMRVCVGRCHEADLAPPYWPWLPVLRDLAATQPAGVAVPAEVTEMLERRAGDPGDADAGVAAATTLRTFAAVAQLLSQQIDASAGPLVVVIEDLHWADQTSLRLLSYVAEELRDRQVLFVATVRTVDPRTHPHLAHALAGLARLAARRVPVPPLDPPAVSELLAGVVPDPDPALIEVLARRCDGNPFFVLEMARLLVATGEPSADAAQRLEVPDGIADVLRLRVLQLPDATRTALAVASVVGRSFDTRLLASALGGAVLDDLDHAVAAGLVEEDGTTGGPHGASGRFRFVHALTRETVYADLPAGRRAHWHALVGRTLAERLVGDAELVGDVAHHHAVAAAYLPDVAEAALEYGREAAVAAERRGAFEEAASLWQRTVDVERGMTTPDPARRHELLLPLARARQRLGDMMAMRAALDEAIELADARDDYLRMAEAATSFSSSGVWHWREMGDVDERTIDVLQRCVDHVEDPGLRARLLAILGVEHYVGLDEAAGDAASEESLRLARAHGDPQVLRQCLSARVITLWSPGNSERRVEVARESLEVAGTPEDEIAARFQLAAGLHHLGRSAESDDVIEVAHAIAAKLRYSGSDVPLGWWRWLRAVETEDPAAERIGQENLALHRRTTMVGITELSSLYTLQCQPVGAPVPADIVAAATGHPFPPFRAMVAHAMAEAGDRESAVRVLDRQPGLGADYAGLAAACRTIQVLALAGHRDLEDAVELVRPWADKVATYGSVYSLGSAAYFVGVGLAALGRVEEARASTEQALLANTAAGSTRWARASRVLLDALSTTRRK